MAGVAQANGIGPDIEWHINYETGEIIEKK